MTHSKSKSEDLIKREVIFNTFTSSACLQVFIHLPIWCHDSLQIVLKFQVPSMKWSASKEPLSHPPSRDLSSQHPGSERRFVHTGVRIFFIFWFNNHSPLYKILLSYLSTMRTKASWIRLPSNLEILLLDLHELNKDVPYSSCWLGASPLVLLDEILIPLSNLRGSGVTQWLRHCTTSRRVPGSIPSHWGFFLGHQTVPCALGSTQPLKMSTRIFLGVKTAGA